MFKPNQPTKNIKKALLIIAVNLGLTAISQAEIIAVLDTTDGHHYTLEKIGSIWEMTEPDGFEASGIWAGILLFLDGRNGCKAVGTRVGNMIDWEITDPYRLSSPR